MSNGLKKYRVRDDVSEIDGVRVSDDRTIQLSEASALYHLATGVLLPVETAKK
jgi:hypothetical protein